MFRKTQDLGSIRITDAGTFHLPPQKNMRDSSRYRTDMSWNDWCVGKCRLFLLWTRRLSLIVLMIQKCSGHSIASISRNGSCPLQVAATTALYSRYLYKQCAPVWTMARMYVRILGTVLTYVVGLTMAVVSCMPGAELLSTEELYKSSSKCLRNLRQCGKMVHCLWSGVLKNFHVLVRLWNLYYCQRMQQTVQQLPNIWYTKYTHCCIYLRET